MACIYFRCLGSFYSPFDARRSYWFLPPALPHIERERERPIILFFSFSFVVPKRGRHPLLFYSLLFDVPEKDGASFFFLHDAISLCLSDEPSFPPPFLYKYNKQYRKESLWTRIYDGAIERHLSVSNTFEGDRQREAEIVSGLLFAFTRKTLTQPSPQRK